METDYLRDIDEYKGFKLLTFDMSGGGPIDAWCTEAQAKLRDKAHVTISVFSSTVEMSKAEVKDAIDSFFTGGA